MKDLTNADTFNEATEQEVFDFVSTHLLTQGQRSVDRSGSCSYRGDNGLKCAAGCLVSNWEYDQEFEGRSWLMVHRCIGMTNHLQLVSELQIIHDKSEVLSWRDQLETLAKDRGLSSLILRS